MNRELWSATLCLLFGTTLITDGGWSAALGCVVMLFVVPLIAEGVRRL